MKIIIFSFPILFLFHEIEEFIGFEKWYNKNKEKLSKYNKISKILDNVFSYYSTKGMLFSIFEQLLLIIIVCLLAVLFNFYMLYLAVFIVYTIHLIIHLFQTIILKIYVPSFITSIIELPLCFYIIYIFFNRYDFSYYLLIYYSIVALLIAGLNLYFLHKLMKKINY